MARIAPALADVDESVQGQVRAIYAHRPEVAAARAALNAAIARTSTLGPRLTELVRLRIAFHNQCRTCMAARYAPDTVDEALVCSLERPQDALDFTDAERAALRYADLFATEHLAIDDAVHDGLRRHFDEGQLVELGILCANFVGYGRLAATWHMVEHLPEAYRRDTSGAPLAPWDAAATPR